MRKILNERNKYSPSDFVREIEHMMFLRGRELRMRSEDKSDYIWLSTTYGTFKLSLEEMTTIKRSANKLTAEDLSSVYVQLENTVSFDENINEKEIPNIVKEILYEKERTKLLKSVIPSKSSTLLQRIFVLKNRIGWNIRPPFKPLLGSVNSVFTITKNS